MGSGALGLVGVLGKPVDDRHAERDDYDRQHRSGRDNKEPPDGSYDGEEVAHHQPVSPSSEEVYARIQRDDRDDQVQEAPEDEVRVHQVARVGHPPAGACEVQKRAQGLQASHHEHHDGGEGHYTGPVHRYPGSDRIARRGAGSSRYRFAVLIRHSLSPLLSLCVVPWGLHVVYGLLHLPGVRPNFLLHLLLGVPSRLIHTPLDRRLSNHDQGRLALLEHLTYLLEVRVRHPSPQGADECSCSSSRQPANQDRGREDEADRGTDRQASPTAVLGWFLYLVYYLDLAFLVFGEDGGVVGAHEVLVVELL